ncbi:2-oxoacid:acceptor oxidoreductase subunit alpha [Desulfonatronovibrio hydrogenovorans]|uniref:2-oxoacid:acceptor oxidoreductase subunit alpha n=1 Tax=Desulfonatronovibrio hydrogenovorans TaxID=53245 RepID=UPI000490464D|nr:2-oxoacid:acceptor oxidoreductase subunit alpha [Desulfonatronovibrio hydrogenovorans]
MRRELNILIGGEAGQGLVTVGELLTKALIRSGYNVHVCQGYMSRIRGGHNTFAVRAGVERVLGPVSKIDILVALNQETITLHKGQMREDGLVLKDKEIEMEGDGLLEIPFKELAPSPLFENVVGLGFLSALLGLDKAVPQGCIKDIFGKKKPEVVEKNLDVLEAAYSFARKQGIQSHNLARTDQKPGLMLTGNDGVILGAMAAGVNFCSYYPMTPSTGIPMTLNAKGKSLGIVVEQAEDEIAAINMAIGASYAGARSMVATSGGGFALMCEGVSLAGMTETPIVIVVGQRPGPATGLPTRTEQGDLNLVLYSGHGEFPRAIFAPGNPEQGFDLTVRAFDLAERSQGPVFVLTDQYLADSYRNVPPFDLSRVKGPASPGDSWPDPQTYQRYALTDDGVSPRLVPTLGPYLVVADSDEHYPDGHITEDLEVRTAMTEKRLSKEKIIKQDVVPPDYYGPDQVQTLLVCWGSTLGPALEAQGKAGKNKVGVLHFTQVWPLDQDHFRERMGSAGRVVFVESNATAQFARLLEREVVPDSKNYILRYDGLPLDAEYILARLDLS